MSRQAEMEVRVLGGLPLTATFVVEEPDHSVGYNGGIADLQLFDRRGKPADWAEARLDQKAWRDLECFILENYEPPEREYYRD